MAGREQYPEEIPRKRAKKEAKDEQPLISESILGDLALNLASEQPRLFEVKGIRKEIAPEGSKVNLLEKSASTLIDQFCEEYQLDKKGSILDIMESATKEFYNRIVDKVNSIKVDQPEKVRFTSDPRGLLKEKYQIMHNQRRASELTGKIKDIDLMKILNTGKWKLKSLSGNI
ncbi:hypothetical protein SteCoe_13133 [Stentor coeruleus]|uniref:Uncharacterized protein n=1 Tax=Stentor coeruleus TaxID=5963 RepID=A0A1R2C974_9CILI|nr:hypothetical protein SteCoe_13133 [Stentor coeruleus]